MSETKEKQRLNLSQILLGIVILFLAYNQFFGGPRETIETKETTTVDIEKKIDSAVNSALANHIPVQQPTIIYRDKVVPIFQNTPIPEADRDKVKNLNKYQDTTILEDGKIYSEILSDGIVYQNKVKAEMNIKTITKTKETTRTIHASGLYVMPEVHVNKLRDVNSVGTSLLYIHKSDIGIGIGANYELGTGAINYSIKALIKL